MHRELVQVQKARLNQSSADILGDIISTVFFSAMKEEEFVYSYQPRLKSVKYLQGVYLKFYLVLIPSLGRARTGTDPGRLVPSYGPLM